MDVDAAASLGDIELLFDPFYVKRGDADPPGFDDIGESGRIILVEEKGSFTISLHSLHFLQEH